MRKRVHSFDDAVSVLVEHDEKIAFCGQQFSKQHIQFNADTQWGTASGADEADDKLQFFA
jgi:hypothetical protein